MQHLISAVVGLEHSLNFIKEMLTESRAMKAQYAEAFKGGQDAAEETKSPHCRPRFSTPAAVVTSRC